jgi:hypothetical protein
MDIFLKILRAVFISADPIPGASRMAFISKSSQNIASVPSRFGLLIASVIQSL